VAEKDSPDRRQAEQYAWAIVEWHSKVNAADLTSRFPGSPDWISRYEHIVRHFVESDLSDPEVWRAIAKEQISGCMEWAYGQLLPEPPVGYPSINLGELARELSRLALLQEPARRRMVYFETAEELLRTAREFYGDAIGPNRQGGGGLSFLVSCSLERSDAQGHLELLSPEVLGAVHAPTNRPDDFIEQIRNGEVEVEEVIGGEHVFRDDSDTQQTSF
jgi:hypothetical protein